MIVDIPCTSVRLSKWDPVTDSSDESIGRFIGIAGLSQTCGNSRYRREVDLVEYGIESRYTSFILSLCVERDMSIGEGRNCSPQDFDRSR